MSTRSQRPHHVQVYLSTEMYKRILREAEVERRSVSECVREALEELLGGSSPLALDAIGTPAVGMRDLVVAVVVSTSDKGEAVAVGSALNSGEASEAAVRAVLDAMNRRIPELLR